MKSFLMFVRKEFYHIFRDPRTLLILFGMPIMLVILFGFALTNEIKDADLAVLDFDKGVHARNVQNRLFSSGYFGLRNYLTSYDQIEAAFREGHVKMALVIPAGFSNDLDHLGQAQLQLVADASDQNTAISLVNYASSIIKTYELETLGSHQPRAGSGAADSGAAGPGVRIETQSRLYFNPALKGEYTFVPGTMALILLLVSAMLTSITIAREKELGTMEVLLVSPLRQLQIILGKLLPYFLLSFINAIIILALGVWVLGMPVRGSVTLLLLESLLYIFVALALGVLISTRAGSQQAAMLTSAFSLLMPTLILSGFLFPIESMPLVLQWISTIIPARYFIDILKGIMLKGLGLADLWRETAVLAGMALFLLVLGFRSLNNRLT
ncbi:ABC-2 type transport system permease protein [Catalinimonas alkaloidigena]|uniref:Transport permease protein n=1 Tax=Catalinimonas alkaloidigena TaxID=1075417 RepID=A0A1G9D5C5_9BACT|nr:ABC transporter permease [Catalinimonas alkaloidigena]SDK59128.1 ABC-2 type transport system permease protein [Catalinimonas alkaloidigena]